MFVFINPTGKNVSAHPLWQGIRAQWLGTKHVWKLFYAINALSKPVFDKTQTLAPQGWTPEFSEKLYQDIARHKIYITNLAKCTQNTAQPISKQALRAYLPLLMKEIDLVRPRKIITFGNEISSLIIGKSVSMKNYSGAKYANVFIGTKNLRIYPCHYPVGQGMRNLPKAIKRIKVIL